MKYLLSILFITAPIILLHGHSRHPKRTNEDIARKQTEMLIRELNIQDSLVRDTLFRMHLKFARKRAQSNTRAEAMQYMQEANAELQQILTPEQYLLFMNQQINHSPHFPKAPHNRFTQLHVDSLPPLQPEAPDMLPPPPGLPPTDLL